MKFKIGSRVRWLSKLGEVSGFDSTGEFLIVNFEEGSIESFDLDGRPAIENPPLDRLAIAS